MLHNFRVKGDEMQIIAQNHQRWISYVADNWQLWVLLLLQLTVIASTCDAVVRSYGRNSIGPIIATVCIEIVCTVVFKYQMSHH
jgi:hypothetical protein